MHTHISTEQLSLALDKRISPQEQARLHDHLTVCPTCRQEWDSWQSLSGRLEQAPLVGPATVSYTHLRAHETVLDIVCRLLLEKKKNTIFYFMSILFPHIKTHAYL